MSDEDSQRPNLFKDEEIELASYWTADVTDSEDVPLAKISKQEKKKNKRKSRKMHECDKCGSTFLTKSKLFIHYPRCIFCFRCEKFLDITHVDKCLQKMETNKTDCLPKMETNKTDKSSPEVKEGKMKTSKTHDQELKDSHVPCPNCPESFTPKALSKHMKVLHDAKDWSLSQHPSRILKSELIQNRFARKELQVNSLARLEELEAEKNFKLNRITEIDDQKKRLAKLLQEEKHALMAAVLDLDAQIQNQKIEYQSLLSSFDERAAELEGVLGIEREEDTEGESTRPAIPGSVDVEELMHVILEIPENINLYRHRPTTTTSEVIWSSIPDVIGETIISALPPSVPINAAMPYAYLQAGSLPHFVVAFFMRLQDPKRTVKYETLFARVMHRIEEYREWRLHQSGAFEQPETSLGPIEPIIQIKHSLDDRATPDPARAEDSSVEAGRLPGLPPNTEKNYSDWKESNCKQQ